MMPIKTSNDNFKVEKEVKAFDFLPSSVKANLTSGATSHAVRVPFESIPVVDVSSLVNAVSEEEGREVAKEIGEACRNVGFMYIKNHGVTAEQRNAVAKASKLFFGLPLEEKMKIWIGNSESHRGYFPLLEEALATAGDLKEGVDVGPDRIHQKIDGLRGPNQWPEEEGDLVGFRLAMNAYFETLTKLARSLLRGLALSMGLPWTYFDEKTSDPMAALRVLHYPPQTAATASDSTIGCGAHTDYGCLTILDQDDVGGLQVWSGERWIAAPPIPDTFVVNIGDMTSMWTDEVYPATVHRVVNASGRDRYSVPFFFNPNYDTVIEPLLSQRTSFTPIKAGDHLKNRFDASFQYREKEEGSA